MKIKSVTVRKGFVKRSTVKDRFGSYNANENSAEITLTFEGEDIDIEEAKRLARDHVKSLLDGDSKDPDWIDHPTETEQEKQQKQSIQAEKRNEYFKTINK